MDQDLFTASPLASYLLCPLCGRVLRDPVLHTTCGHSFCSGCLLAGGGPAKGICPKDGESVADVSSIIPNLTLKDGLSKLRLRCLYRYRLTSDAIAAAAGQSPAGVDGLLPLLSRPLQVDDDGCDAELILGELDSHLLLCPHRWERCATCSGATRANQLALASDQQARLVCPECVAAASDRPVTTYSSSARNGLNLAVTNDNSSLETTADADACQQQQQQPISRDQLRTMLANQRRLDEAVASLSGRLAGLTGRLNQRLDALETAWQPRLETGGLTGPAAAAAAAAVQLRAAATACDDSSHLQMRESTVSSVLSEMDPPQLLQAPQPQPHAEWTMPFSLTCTGSFCGHTAPIVHLAVGPDPSLLYSFGQDGEIRAWDALAGRCCCRVLWPEGAVAQLTCACVPDAREDFAAAGLFAGSGSGCLARLSMAGTPARPELRVADCVSGAHAGRPVTAMCTRWRLLFTCGDAEIRVWRLPELTGLRHVTSLQRQVCGLCLVPTGLQRTLLAVCRNRICLFGVSELLPRRDGCGGGGGGGGDVGVDAEELHVLSFTRVLKKNFGVPYCLLATQRHIIVGTAKKGIWLFDAHLGDHVTCLGVELGAVKSVACTASGNWLLSTTLDGAMHVWDVRGQRQVQKTHWHRGPVFSVLLLADTVYSGSADMDIKVFKYTNLKMTPMYQQIAADSRTPQQLLRPL